MEVTDEIPGTRNATGQVAGLIIVVLPGRIAVARIVGFFVSAMGTGLIFHGLIEVLQWYGITPGQALALTSLSPELISGHLVLLQVNS
jgi:hypothetical protein